MEAIYQEHAKTVYAYLLLRCCDKPLAEELTQETFYQAMKSLNSFKKESSVETWLISIAKNVWYQYLKKKKQYISIDDIDIVSDENIEKKLVRKYERESLMTSIHTLQDPYKEIIYLRLYANLSYKEIGRIFNKSETWARVSYYRAKEMLIRMVKDNE